METHEILAGAADKILNYGHFKGCYGNAKVGYCVKGAIACTITETTHPELDILYAAHTEGAQRAFAAMIEYLGLDTDEEDLHEWNDQRRRTGEQVIHALQSCSIALEAERMTAGAPA